MRELYTISFEIFIFEFLECINTKFPFLFHRCMTNQNYNRILVFLIFGLVLTPIILDIRIADSLTDMQKANLKYFHQQYLDAETPEELASAKKTLEFYQKQYGIQPFNPTGGPSQASPSKASTSIDPTIFIILGIIAAIGGGVAVAIMKRKSKPIKPIIPQPIPTTKSDDTMFYGCPRCGNNTKIFYGRQYCPVCKIYL